MASVTVDSGEFPLIRNIDVAHQPSRSKVYDGWIRAFSDDVPSAVEHLADIIEDVYAYELWKDKYLATPELFLEEIGILGLDLDEPAKLLKELRKKRSSKKAEIIARAYESKAMREQGMTQQAIADELGVSKGTVNSDICSENTGMPQKPEQEKRKRVTYQIQSGTTPATAAHKIRAKFGPAFARELAHALTE